jgi:hypothetical protein
MNPIDSAPSGAIPVSAITVPAKMMTTSDISASQPISAIAPPHAFVELVTKPRAQVVLAFHVPFPEYIPVREWQDS